MQWPKIKPIKPRF